MSLLLFASNFINAADSARLAHSTDGHLAANEITKLPLQVAEGDYLNGNLVSSEYINDVVLLAPSGKHYKQLNVAPVDNQFIQLHAEEAGTYQLQITAGDQPLSFTFNVKTFATQQDQHIVVDALQSPRLQALANDIHAGISTEVFWQEMAQQGTPLVEPHENPELRLVTFLWRGAKHNVRLLGSPVGKHAFMQQLADSDVWYLSFTLPHTTRLSYQLSPDTPQLPELDTNNRISIKARAQMDPLNKAPWRVIDKADRFSTLSTLTLENAPSDQWIADKAHPRGDLEDAIFDSKILSNRRRITVYRPHGFAPQGQTMPVLFFFDSQAYQSKVPTPRILDNLIAAKKIPPAIAVFISNPGRNARATELPCNPDFAQFLATELLPWTERTLNIKTTAETTLLSGSSYGGLAATCTAFKYPQKFGLVLSQSGSFWWSPEYNQAGNYIPEWVAQQFANADHKPIRFYLNAGLFEQGWQPSDILPSNRHMRDVLTAKGYDLSYEELASGHDYFSWRVKLADGLIQLLRP